VQRQSIRTIEGPRKSLTSSILIFLGILHFARKTIFLIPVIVKKGEFGPYQFVGFRFGQFPGVTDLHRKYKLCFLPFHIAPCNWRWT
jgi:hypothetical protein